MKCTMIYIFTFHRNLYSENFKRENTYYHEARKVGKGILKVQFLVCNALSVYQFVRYSVTVAKFFKGPVSLRPYPAGNSSVHQICEFFHEKFFNIN